jgi:hypothetical protein
MKEALLARSGQIMKRKARRNWNLVYDGSGQADIDRFSEKSTGITTRKFGEWGGGNT